MTTLAPVLFIGHGSPMNALADNQYTHFLNELGKAIPKPKAILCISSHWLTRGTWITHMNHPKTIHDFYGFPKELFEIQYQAPGAPELARLIKSKIQKPIIQLDENWGLDHGAWSILLHLYPKADIPVLELSVDMSEPPEFHFELGKQLRQFRKENILILGSGNIVHNLQLINWQSKGGLPWASKFDEAVKEHLIQKNYHPLMGDLLQTEFGKLSVPTPDHYYPFLYVLGASEENEKVSFEYEGMELGSLSMRSLSFGRI